MSVLVITPEWINDDATYITLHMAKFTGPAAGVRARPLNTKEFVSADCHGVSRAEGSWSGLVNGSEMVQVLLPTLQQRYSLGFYLSSTLGFAVETS